MTQVPKLPDDHVISDAEVEQRIREFFDRNYDLLRQEGGHALAEGARRQAYEEVLFYWRKLRALATSVTDTEVTLALPGQKTPTGRPFVIEGIVDIVRDGDQVRMYDLKTHEAQDVRRERGLYEDQLNVYAHIWKGIHRRSLDSTAIIATQLPSDLRDALRRGDAAAVNRAMARWNPVVDLEFNERDVAETIGDFGRCVDAIEDGKFPAPSPDDLQRPPRSRGRSGPPFADVYCRNCDGRFSCVSFRDYSRGQLERSRGALSPDQVRQDDDPELDAWIEDNLAGE